MAFSIGTLISGTHRTQDLIPVFLEQLGREDTTLPGDDDDEWWYSEEAQEYVHGLFDELDATSPPYCYFGAHEGDGSDFGFWPIFHRYDEYEMDRENVFVCNDASKLCSPECHHSEAFVINDHGNVAFYQWGGHDWEEIWSCV